MLPNSGLFWNQWINKPHKEMDVWKVSLLQMFDRRVRLKQKENHSMCLDIVLFLLLPYSYFLLQKVRFFKNVLNYNTVTLKAT